MSLMILKITAMDLKFTPTFRIGSRCCAIASIMKVAHWLILAEIAAYSISSSYQYASISHLGFSESGLLDGQF
jgi:hypothetical protein